jgi:Uncharacterized conserved protein
MFTLTKIIWMIFQPVNLIFLIIFSGLILHIFRYKIIGIKFIYCGVILLAICGFFPIGKFLSLTLENRFSNEIIKNPYGIIVLGGSENVITSLNREQISLNSSSERLIYFYILSKKYPDSKLVFSGGGKFNNEFNESTVARKFFKKMNMNIDRIIFENRSRNTYENAKFSYELVNPNK